MTIQVSEQSPLLGHQTQPPSTCPSSTAYCCESNTASCCATSTVDQVKKPPYCQLSDQPWENKCVALLCALFLAGKPSAITLLRTTLTFFLLCLFFNGACLNQAGSHFAAHTLGAMKNTIKQEFGISNSQYGVLQSSVAIVNTILPVFGGIFIDAFGTVPGSICATVLITSGNILVALSTHSANWNIMIIGRVLYGIGSGSVVVVQEAILSQWYRGRSLAAVVALMLTVSRLASFLAQATVVPIANWSGFYGYGFWFSALLCLFSLVINLFYVALLRKVVPVSNVDHCKSVLTIKRKKAFHWGKLLYLPHAYWLILTMEFLLGGGWSSFLTLNSEFVKYRFGYNDTHAAATASVAQILPIFFMPLLGVFVDRYGKRIGLIIGSGITFTLAIYLLNYTYFHPLVGMLFFSVSLALGPVGMVSSVPVLLPLSFVGTGLGLIKCATNVGTSLFDIGMGWLQDQDANKGYSGVMTCFLIIGGLSTLVGWVLWIMDHRLYDHLLDQSAASAQRREKMAAMKQDAMADRPLKMNYLYGAILFGFLVTSWGLFIQIIVHQ